MNNWTCVIHISLSDWNNSFEKEIYLFKHHSFYCASHHPSPWQLSIQTLKKFQLMTKFYIKSLETTWKFIFFVNIFAIFFLSMLLLVLSKYLNLICTFGGNKCRYRTAEQMNGEKYLRRFKRKKKMTKI